MFRISLFRFFAVLTLVLGGAGARAQTTISGTYTGQTIADSINLAASTSAIFTGNSNFTGPNATFGNGSYLQWQQAGSLLGKTITLGASAYIYVAGASSSLTLDLATTASGNLRLYSDGSAGTAITNQGSLTQNSATGGILYARTFTNSGSITATASTLQVGSTTAGYNTVNSGNITANGSGVTVYLDGNVANTGTLTATNTGALRFRGNNTTANLGSIVLNTGGRALLDGVLDNTSATLTSPTGGPFELFSGKITGGTIAGNALTFTSSGGYLDNTILTGAVNLPANTNAYVTGNSALNAASVTFGANAYFYVTSDNSTLSLNAATSATGDLRFYTSGNTGTAITNLGTLTQSVANTGYLYGRTFTNQGSITASAGALQVGYNSAGYNTINSGTITANGSGVIVYLDGNVSNTGTLSAINSGRLVFRGTNPSGIGGTVQLASGGRAVIDGILVNSTLAAPTGGMFELTGGTIQGGTIAPGALTYTTSGGFLSGATLNDNLVIPASAFVRFTGNAAFTGATGTLGANAGLYWEQVATLAGKAITLGSGAYLYVNGVNNALTLDATTTVTGDLGIYASGSAGTVITNQGTLTHTGGNSSIYAATFTNAGSITANAGTLYLGYPSAGYNSTNAATGVVTANGSGTTVYLRGNFANSGTLVAQNAGILRFDGTNATGNLGNVTLATGGRALLDGILVNSTLTPPTGGAFELDGGTIQGGTIAPGALTYTSSGGYLSGATLNANLVIPASAFVRFTGNATFTGATGTFGANAGLYWEQIGVLAGKAITLGSGAYLYVNGVNNALTLDAATTVTGDLGIYSSGSAGTAITNQGALTHTGGNSSIYAATFTNAGSITANAGTLYLGYPSAGYNSINAPTGVVTANGSGTNVYIRGNFTNSGTLVAQNSGILRFDGTNTSANLGNVTLTTGGRALLSGTLATTTLAAPTGGAFELAGGTIQGGAVAAGALTFTSSGGYLDGTTVAGSLNFPTSAYARLINGTTLSGAGIAFASGSGIYWQQVGTLAGQSLSFGSGAYLYVTGANNTLTLGPTTTATGDVSIYTDGSAGTSIANQGALTHTVGSGSLYGLPFSNTGTITATGGTLYLGYNAAGYNFANGPAGNITVAGGTVIVRQPTGVPLLNQGVINVQSGTLQTGNLLTNSPGGIIGGAGIISGGLTLAGGTIAPGNSVGTLTLNSSTFVVTTPSNFAVELGGASADLLLFNNPTAPINLGTGLLSLSVSLLSPPTVATYDLIRIGTGTGVINGTFVGLPNSGDTFNAYFGGNPYTFAVNYQPTFVAINFVAVPEPSTYVLLALGGLGIALLRRRRA